MEGKYIISPSLMCMDYLHIGDQLKVLNKEFDWFHFDIMDGNYCPNLALNIEILKAVKKVTDIPVDVHIMAKNPDDFLIDKCIEAKADHISVHPETLETSIFRTINKIHDAGLKAGIVINPMTTLESVEYLLNRIDILTIMTIDVGFAGQKFIEEMYKKIEQAKAMRSEKGYHYLIQVDGACKRGFYKPLADAGVDCFIVGNSGLFSLDEDIEKACLKMHESFKEEVGG